MRPSQGLGLLSRGLRIGAADFGAARRATVTAALRLVWERLPRAVRATAKEPIVTGRLQQLLNELANSDEGVAQGFSREAFETVNRGGEVPSADGQSIEKRPDLVFRPVGRLPFAPEEFGLFVECKIVSDQPSVRRYCDDGLMRFVKAEYAGAMRDAMMLAYVRGDATIPVHLTGQLVRKPEYETLSPPSRLPGDDEPALWRSRHGRSALPEPIDIGIDHLWFVVRDDSKS